jgi:CRISPR-associated protein Csh1
MIKAIRDLGFFELKEVSGQEIFNIEEFEKIKEENPQLIARLIAEKATARTGIKVYVLKIEEGKLTYELDETVYKGNDCREDRYRDYLFKEPRSSKGSYISPTFKLSPPVSEKAKKKDEPSTSASRLYKYIEEAPDDLKEFKAFGAKAIDLVLQKIREENKDNKASILITIKPNGNYPANSTNVSKKFIEGFIRESKYLDQNAPKDYNHENQRGQCSICLRENKSLLGYLRPYNFFTVDKVGFYSGFKNYESWKYFPVCESCGILIQAGKNFLENHFRARIAGYNTLVIAKNKELVERQKKFVDFNSMKSFKQIANIEKVLIKKLPELTTLESYNFMFYREKQNQFEILLLIPDVLPSRIKNIVDAIKGIKERFEQSNWFDLDNIQKNNGNWRIDADFYFLEEGVGERVDLPKIEYSPTTVKVLDLIQAVFLGHPVAYREVVYEITSKIQFCFKQSLKSTKDNRPIIDKFAAYVFSGAATIEFLKEAEVMETQVTKAESIEEYPQKLKEVFEKHKTFFDTPQKRACFLVGVLYGKLEGKQTALDKKGASLGWLRSLDLKWEYITKELYPRIHHKFKEYDQIGDKKAAFTEETKVLFDIASHEFSSCGNIELPREEIPFYFTLGWTTYKRFFPTKEELESETETKKE